METYEAIMTRRSIPKTGDGVPDRARIARLLDAAVAAPNHHLTQPWRFVVLAGDALKELGDALAEHAARTDGRPEIARDLPHRAPVIITVIDRAGHDHHVSEIDEHYAVGAAIQNILLAAHDDGLAAMIRTGPHPYIPEVQRYVGLAPEESIAGFIYVGFPAPGYHRKPPRTTPAAELTEWRGL